MTTDKQRKDFFGNLLSYYDGELNEIYDGLSYIEKHLTHIDNITDKEACGFYLGRSGRKIPFFAIKDDDKIGIGASYGHASDVLLMKQTIGISEEQRLSEFIESHEKDKSYTVENLWDWHRYLTLSCYSGGERFRDEHGLKMEDLMSIQHFISITENDFGGHIIKKLKPYYFSDKN